MIAEREDSASTGSRRVSPICLIAPAEHVVTGSGRSLAADESRDRHTQTRLFSQAGSTSSQLSTTPDGDSVTDVSSTIFARTSPSPTPKGEIIIAKCRRVTYRARRY